MDKVRGQPKNVRVLIILPRKLHEAAKRKRHETGISVSFVARKAIESWVNEKKGGQG